MAYLDHAATTPMLPVAVEAVVRQMSDLGNPSSMHGSGRRARRVVEESRETLATAFGCRPGEVVFTSGGTEADNLAVKGLFWSRRDADPRRVRVLVGAAEHHAVLDSAEWLATHEGAVVELLPVDDVGRVRPEVLSAALARGGDDVALVSVMWANNEVGTVNDVPALARIAHAAGVPIHTDAVQAAGQLPLDFAASGVDAMSVTAHKIGGPVGVGALLLARGLTLVSVQHGGGQERDVRSGTLDVAGVAGFAAAAAACTGEALAPRAARLAQLRDSLVAAVAVADPDAQLNGDPDPAGRLPGNAHFSFPDCEGDALLMLLDAAGVECSTGSACSAGVAQPSHVLLAMGSGGDRARSSLRFSLGSTSSAADVEALARSLPGVVGRARRASGRTGVGVRSS
jgi:cysteine desulfurase